MAIVINCTEIMRERLLNPKRLNIELEALQITIIDNVSYKEKRRISNVA